MRTLAHAGSVSEVESTALSRLFTRFVSGQISDLSWSRIMWVLDEGETSAEERVALVNFLNDACTDLGPDAVEVPALVEVDDMVSMMRAA